MERLIKSIEWKIKNNKEILSLLLIFIVLYSFDLSKYPVVWIDEGWFINPAFNLAFHGFFGTTMMPDFYNIAHFTYWQMPLYMVLVAISFKLFGFGIVQARMVSVFLGFFTILFTYLLGKELFTKKVGLLATSLLIVNPLFFRVAREVRMDIAVACFTLIALYFLVMALKRSKHKYYFCSGLFAILSFLSHPNGIFCIISIILIYCSCRIDFKNLKIHFNLKEVVCLITGPLIASIPYLYYISLDFQAFKNQYEVNILSSGNNPLINISLELIRYKELIYFFGGLEGQITVLLIVTTLSLILFGMVYILKNRNKFSSKFLFIVISVPLVLLTVLVIQKHSMWYLGIVLPYLFILMVVPFKIKFNHKNVKVSLAVLLIITITMSSLGIFSSIYQNKDYDYQTIQSQIQGYIPTGSVIVGDPQYWITLHNNYTYYDYHYMNSSDFQKLRGGYVLYDSGWDYVIHSDFFEGWCFNSIIIDTPTFLRTNCTLVGIIPFNQNINMSPIFIYRIN